MKNQAYVFLLGIIMLSASASAQTDFRFDSVLYNTIYPADLYQFIKSNPKAILIDVRTPGEYADTSSYGHLNIGRLKGAINIPIDSLPHALDSLKKYSDTPILLYCSHSQRSRRSSKLLSENNFKQIYNVNGGMSVLTQADEGDFPHKKDMIVSSLLYQSLSADEAVQLLRTEKDMLILDVRPIAQFEGKDTLEILNVGKIKKAVNIPASEIKNNLIKIESYKNKSILVYDNRGSESNGIAKYLAENGYAKATNLLGGLSAIIGRNKETMNVRKEILESGPLYNLLNVKETVNLINKNAEAVILDIRPAEEFNNKSGSPWRNIGNIKNAIHIPPAEFDARMKDLLKYRKATLIIYGTVSAAALSCKKLKEHGFEDVNLIYGGLFDMVSSSFNIKSLMEIKSLLVNHQGLY